MNIQQQIDAYIRSQPEPKQKDLLALHELILSLYPKSQLWFHDGKDDKGKVVSNPNIGYGNMMIRYANGSTKEWFKLSISGNTTGISIYMLGLKDKTYLNQNFSKTIGKASITGYCIKFKALKDLDLNVLKEAIRYGFEDSL